LRRQAAGADSEPRFTMLETIREYVLREAGNAPLSPIARAENERQVATLRAALGDAAFAAAWAEGRVMTVEQVLAQAAGGDGRSNPSGRPSA
jgi:hypothetical protein